MGTREVLIVDRDPWRLSLYRTDETDRSMSRVAVGNSASPGWIDRQIVPLRFMLEFTTSLLRIEGMSVRVLREVAFQKE